MIGIQLTQSGGRKIIVNPDNITYVGELSAGCEILFNGERSNGIIVEESLDHIVKCFMDVSLIKYKK